MAASSSAPVEKKKADWQALELIWSGSEEGVRTGTLQPPLPLAPAWRFLLLGDGSPTRHLQLLTGSPTQVDVIEMKNVGSDLEGAPADVKALTPPLVRRQVWLRTSSGQRLAYATSWWEASNVEQHLSSPSDPIWVSLSKNRTELYREIQTAYYGHSKALEEAFGEVGPLWGRHYTFWHKGKPLTVIYEVFSPHLSEFLGSPIQGPSGSPISNMHHHHDHHSHSPSGPK